jgi:hypothetical protein
MLEQQQKTEQQKFKDSFNIAFFWFLVHQRGLTVLMRNQWGVQALGFPCGLAFVLMLVWASFARDPFMLVWTAVWLLYLLRRQREAARNARKTHSQYDGWPLDAMRFCRTQKTAKLVVEPILVAIFGSLLWWIYRQMGWDPHGLPAFLLAGIITLPFVERVKQAAWERRLQGMQDARLEQEALVRESHKRFGDS